MSSNPVVITLASRGGPRPSTAMLGVPLGLRAILREQYRGARRIWLWPAGHDLGWLADDRVKVEVDVLDAPPEHGVAYDEVAGVRIDSAEAWREAEDRLLLACRKSTDGLVSRHLNRRLSLWLSRHLARRGVRPHAMTALTLLVALAGAFLVAQGSYAAMATGAGLIQLSSVLDGCDGELARLTFRSSSFGAWMDTIADDLGHLAYWGALAMAARGHHLWWWWMGWVAVAANALAAGLTYPQLWRLGDGNWFALTPSPSPLVRGLTLLFRRDAFLFALWLAALWGYLLCAVPVVMVGAIITLGAAARRSRQPPKRK